MKTYPLNGLSLDFQGHGSCNPQDSYGFVKSRENFHGKAGRSWCLASGGLDATVVFWQRSGRGEDLGSKKIVVEDDAWMSQEVSKWLVDGLYNLLIRMGYIGVMTKLLTFY